MTGFHENPRLPTGFRCASARAGLKREGDDLALFYSESPGVAAGLFTRNHFPGAPILLGREQIRGGRLQAIIVNAGISNVATGPGGLDDAREMTRLAAAEVGVDPELVLVGSTGVIGRPLPMDRLRAGIPGMGARLGVDPWPAARAIMTTDRVPKVISTSVGGAVITAVGKGAGMIAPNLATMLVYLFTDARIEPSHLQASLRAAADRSFDLLSVDTDTSTSDMVVALANGAAGEVVPTEFAEAVERVCVRMAEMVARDGEGATKLIRVRVEGALDDGQARRIARSVVDSPLVKTMAYGADPNVGRILMAVGKCVDCRIEPGRVDAWVQGIPVVRGGFRADFSDAEVREKLGRDVVEIRVSLGVGDSEGLALGCDLTEGYIVENASYASS